MIYAFLILAWLCYSFMPMDDLLMAGVSSDNYIGASIYFCAHASWLHLIINTISMLILWPPIQRLYVLRYNTSGIFLQTTCYWAAVIAGLACATEVPTVGMSGMVFFLLGVLIMLNPTKHQALNYLWIVAAVLLQWYFGKSNVALHLFAFVEGALYICIREFIYQYTHDKGLFEPTEC